MEKTITFVDAQEMGRKHPDTFEVPTNEELDAIKKGDSVKICDEEAGERFWVTVDEIDGNKITGFVNNQLVSSDLHYGDLISFETRHIYSIY